MKNFVVRVLLYNKKMSQENLMILAFWKIL